MPKELNILSKEFNFCTTHTCDHGWESQCNVECEPHRYIDGRPLARVRREKEERQRIYKPVTVTEPEFEARRRGSR